MFKKCSIALIVTLVMGLYYQTQAQTSTRFGVGLQKELFGVALDVEGSDAVSFGVDKVDFAVLLNDFRVGLGVHKGTIVNDEEKRYDSKTGLSLSLSYFFDLKGNEDFSFAPILSVGKSFKDFKSLDGLNVDAGLRTYMFKTMFIGTGLRYARWDDSPITDNHQCFSWFWEIGFDLYLNR